MPENNKQNKPVGSDKFTEAYDRVPQPKDKVVNPFTAMRDRQAAEREAEAARSRRQDQTSE